MSKNTPDLSPSPPPEVEPLNELLDTIQADLGVKVLDAKYATLTNALIAAVRAESSALQAELARQVNQQNARNKALLVSTASYTAELRSALAAQAQEIEQMRESWRQARLDEAKWMQHYHDQKERAEAAEARLREIPE